MVVLGLAGVGAWLWLRMGLVLLQSYRLLSYCHGAMTLDRHVYLPSLTQSQKVFVMTKVQSMSSSCLDNSETWNKCNMP